MKQNKFAALRLTALLLAISLKQETVEEIQMETVVVEETVEVSTKNEKFDDGTTAETVTTVEKLLTSDRTTVCVTTNCIDGTILIDTIITENFRDGGTYAETKKEVQYPEGGGNVTLEIQGTYTDRPFEQVEEYITIHPDGSSYSERTEISADAEGNTTVRMIITETDTEGNETKEETVSVTDADGNPVG